MHEWHSERQANFLKSAKHESKVFNKLQRVAKTEENNNAVYGHENHNYPLSVNVKGPKGLPIEFLQ